MKLSKNRLHRIKRKKNGSKRKKVFRKNKRSHQNTQKKHHRHPNLKNKTLKIYVGGVDTIPETTAKPNLGPSSSKKVNKNQGCAYKDKLQSATTLIKISQPDRVNWVNKYFQVSKNQNCLGDAKDTLQLLLKTYYNKTKDADVTKTKNVRELLGVWNNSAELAAMPRTEADKYNIDYSNITGKITGVTNPKMSDKELKEEYAKGMTRNQMMSNMIDESFKQSCDAITSKIKLPESNEANIVSLSNVIKAKYSKDNDALIKAGGKVDIPQFGNNVYKVDITSRGDCLGDSVVFDILFSEKGNWKNIQGWVPEERKDGGKVGYLGNLRQVLQHYVCANSQQILNDTSITKNQLDKSLARLDNNNLPASGTKDSAGWLTDTEISLLARLFNVFIFVYDVDNKTIMKYTNTGVGSVINESNSDMGNKDTSIYIYNHTGTHYESLINLPADGSKSSSTGPAPAPAPGPNPSDSSKSSSTESAPGPNPSDSSKSSSTESALGLGPGPASKDAAENLNKYDCDPDNLNIDVPDTKEESKQKLKTIDDNFIACINKGPNELSDIEFLLRRDEFLADYEKKFGERLKEGIISPNCRKLFEKEELDYNFVPINNKKEALDKIKRYEDLLLDEGVKNNGECLPSIFTAMDIYTENAEHMYPGLTADLKSDGPEQPSEEKKDDVPFTNSELESMYDKYKKDGVFNKKSLIRCLTAKDDDGIRLRRLFGLPAKLATNNFTTGTPIGKIFATILSTMYGTGGLPPRENKYNGVANESDITLKEFIDFIDCGTKRDKSKVDFKCENVVKPSAPPESGSSTSGPTPGTGASTPGPGASTSGTGASTPGPGASTSGTGASASGTGASTSETGASASGTGASWWNNPFGKSKGPPGPPEAANIPTATATPVKSNNIELEINEKDFDGTLKRVDVSIFIPTDGEVIVRNYAKNNAQETLRGLPVYGIPQ